MLNKIWCCGFVLVAALLFTSSSLADEADLRLKLETTEKTLGPDHPDTATSLNNLALLYHYQGRYAEAEPLYRRVLAIREKALGPEHPDTVLSLNNLASFYVSQGRYAEAEPLLLRALAIREKTLGPGHPDTATSLNKLAFLYDSKGRYAEAEPLYRRALVIREKALGPEHPNTTTSLNNLASLYDSQGRYAEAEPLYRRALAIREKTLGPEHPDTAVSLNNLAYLYNSQGRYAEAEPLYRRALAIREKAPGPEHPDTAASLNNLAYLYYSQGRYAEAEPLLRRALAIREKTLGPGHPDTASSLNNLASLYETEGRYAEAEPLYRRALAIKEKTLGPEHPDTATSLNNLASLYDSQSRYKEAEPLYRRALAIREIALGPEHPDTATSLNNLALLYNSQGRYAEAEPLYRRALAIREKTLGPEHPDIAVSLNNLAVLYDSQGRYAEAEPLYRRALAIREKVLGPEHPDTAVSLNNLASLYNSQGRYAEAEPLYRRVVRINAARLQHKLEGKNTTAPPREETFVPFLQILAAKPLSSAEDLADILTTVQLARRSDTAEAFTQMAQRLAAQESGELSNLVRTRQDLTQQLERAEKRMDEAYAQPAEKHTQTAMAQLAAEVEQLKKRHAEASRLLAEKFPNFVEFEGTQLADMKSLTQVLKPEEVLLGWILGKERSFLYTVDARGLRLVKIDATRAQVEADVTTLRTALSLADGILRPYPAAVAAKLFATLFPKESLPATARHLLLVPEGPLTSLPFSVLLMSDGKTLPEQFTKPEDYRTAPWLPTRYAISVLPSISALPTLRAHGLDVSAAQPFLGVGDPMLAHHPALNGGKARNRSVTSQTLLLTKTISRTRGIADVRQIRNLPSLPETSDELSAMARALHADPLKSLFLRENATEAKVKHLQALDQFRVLAFATHGALAGQLKGNNEPGLILTPPTQGNEEDDGYLSASEIARLKLNADWVLLSACNTAGGTGGEAEGLTGLAKAFAYAGARALFVSHWEVESNATVRLTSTLLQLNIQNKLPRAEAHRQTMLEMIRDPKTEMYHPSFWAPFVVLGDGGR